MQKAIKNEKMTNGQLIFLAHQTCQWWNAVFVQTSRFLDAFESRNGKFPWDDGCENDMFVAERLFLITAIYHAIEDLKKLDIEMQRKNDLSIQSVLQAIETVAPFYDIKNLRDMNEHGLDYLMNKGKKQEEFLTAVKKDDKTILTTAAWTQVRGDAGCFLLGNVKIDKLLIIMKEYWHFVREKTKEISDTAWQNI